MWCVNWGVYDRHKGEGKGEGGRGRRREEMCVCGREGGRERGGGEGEAFY